MRRALEAVLPRSRRGWGEYFANRVFDHWAAVRLPRLRVDAVVGYESGCKELFGAARRMGTATILDAAAIHYAAQGSWKEDGVTPALRRALNSVKQEEIERAGAILTVSRFARDTYIAGGADAERVQVVPLGVDSFRFSASKRPSGVPLRLCFVGSTLERKGIRDLAVAMSSLLRYAPNALLRVAGAVLGPGLEIRKEVASGWEFLGKVRGSELVRLYQESDVLVLPSLEDSFGLVVPEALACGTPVLVTNRTGARDLVLEGVNGWVVPAGDASALAERLLWVASHLEDVRAMRPHCAESVRGNGWEDYSHNLIGILKPMLAARGSR